MSQFILKIIAAITMLIDHAGLSLFPGHTVFRMIGRLAFPIYAYCIAEGFYYTRSKLKYFLRIFLLGAVCQLAYDIAENKVYLGILITFSISILIMSLIDCVKAAFKNRTSFISACIQKVTRLKIPHTLDRILSLAILGLGIAAAFVLCVYVDVDYGFFGIMLPVFTNVFPDRTRRFFMFSASLIVLCIYYASQGVFIQLWSLFTIPIIAAYNGKPGKYRMKYFFYIFYPAHLAIIYLIDLII